MADFNLAGGNFVLQQIIQNPQGLLHDDGADAVAGQDADDDLFQLGKVLHKGILAHTFNAGIFGKDQFRELFLGNFDIFH